MSMMTKTQSPAVPPAGPEEITHPASKRRVLLYAITPILLLALLTAGIRFASEAAQKREADSDAMQTQELRAMRPGTVKGMGTLPKPPLVYEADATTQAALETIVRGQLNAINNRDFSKALSFAIPSIRNSQNPTQFGTMIQQGYSPMLAAKTISFSRAQIQKGSENRRQARVETKVRTTFGANVTYSYMLMNDGKSWWVLGVASRPSAISNEDRAAPLPHPAPMQIRHN